jgi:thiol-disulfide isomerase/thioredoxin
MVYLTAAVVLVGLLGLANLLLLVGVVRRLRKLSAQLPEMVNGPEPGEKIPSFTALTSEGDPISAESLMGTPALIGFFSPSCAPCRQLLPEFVERAGRTSDPVMAVVVSGGDDDAAAEFERLAAVAQVVREEPHGPLQKAFRVSGFPTVITTDATGTVIGSDVDLPETVHA